MAAILDLLWEVVIPPTKTRSWWSSSVKKIRHIRLSNVQVISIWFLCHSRLKVLGLFMSAKVRCLGIWLTKFSGTSFSPRKANLCAEWRILNFWVVFGRVASRIIPAFPIGETLAKILDPSSPIRRCRKTPQAKGNSLDLPLQHGIRESILLG